MVKLSPIFVVALGLLPFIGPTSGSFKNFGNRLSGHFRTTGDKRESSQPAVQERRKGYNSSVPTTGFTPTMCNYQPRGPASRSDEYRRGPPYTNKREPSGGSSRENRPNNQAAVPQARQKKSFVALKAPVPPLGGLRGSNSGAQQAAYEDRRRSRSEEPKKYGRSVRFSNEAPEVYNYNGNPPTADESQTEPKSPREGESRSKDEPPTTQDPNNLQGTALKSIETNPTSEEREDEKKVLESNNLAIAIFTRYMPNQVAILYNSGNYRKMYLNGIIQIQIQSDKITDCERYMVHFTQAHRSQYVVFSVVNVLGWLLKRGLSISLLEQRNLPRNDDLIRRKEVGSVLVDYRKGRDEDIISLYADVYQQKEHQIIDINNISISDEEFDLSTPITEFLNIMDYVDFYIKGPKSLQWNFK